uniref:NADH dehydrogenase subunit 4L n=1 Tax=Tsukubamonas globosa TaxID=875863 RepID=W8VJV9_9EUKA|nr:NADH dehydrogenase subunit 4L [Tsukubamonas globosa]BAO51975.1 NADH dehydrogenase subunit 4L [Tsukubamonas globosa]
MILDFYSFIQYTTLLFLIGVAGIFFNRKNIIVILMAIEIMLLAISLTLIFFSSYLDDAYGYVFSLFILTVAAAESAIGLAILVVYYRVRGTIEVEWIHTLKG